jgi:hypothetical protein
MSPDPERLAALIATLETTGQHYIALGIADAFKNANTVQSSTLEELIQIATAKAKFEVADQALASYRTSHH